MWRNLLYHFPLFDQILRHVELGNSVISHIQRNLPKLVLQNSSMEAVFPYYYNYGLSSYSSSWEAVFPYLKKKKIFTPWAYCYIIFPVQALYPEPCTRVYEICIYLQRSALRVLTASRFRPTRPPTVVGKVCLVTSLESGLSPLAVDIVCTP